MPGEPGENDAAKVAIGTALLLQIYKLNTFKHSVFIFLKFSELFYITFVTLYVQLAPIHSDITVHFLRGKKTILFNLKKKNF